MDSQCPMGLVCGDNKTCVECTPTKIQTCMTSQAGPRCLPSSTCGCTTDSDCGNATSGRVCDTTLQKCTLGCRGMGGNGCQPGRACTSTSSAIGACVAIPDGGFPPDARADAPADLAQDRPVVRDVTAERASDGQAAVDAVSGDRVAIEAGRDVLADARLATDGGTRDGGAQDAGDAADAAGDARRDGPTGIQRGYVGGGGCSCTLPGGPESGSRGGGVTAALLMAVGLILARRRRRR
jgi:MYXO-CTERM domain-containing protein